MLTIRSSRTGKAVKDAPNVHRKFDDALSVTVVTQVDLRAVDNCTESVNEDRVHTFRLHLFYPQPVALHRYNHVTSFLGAALIRRDHRANVFVYKEEVLYLMNMMLQAASVKHMLLYRMIHKGVRRSRYASMERIVVAKYWSRCFDGGMGCINVQRFYHLGELC